MKEDSDSSDAGLSDSEEDGDDRGDLSNLGGASTAVSFRTVTERPFQRVEEGYNRMAQQILEKCQELVPTSGEQRTMDACDGRLRRCVKPVIEQNFIQVQQQFGDVKVGGARNLTIGGTQIVNKGNPVQQNKGPSRLNWIFVFAVVIAVTSVILGLYFRVYPTCYESDGNPVKTFPTFTMNEGHFDEGKSFEQGQSSEKGAEQCRKAQRIMEWTVSRIQTWTKGMVKTSSLEKVLAKLRNGMTWITIKGSPGEGKTTVAYMVLDQLHREGRRVFQLTSPEEFTEVNTTFTQPVILLDDILGDLEFDQTAWQRWRLVLHKIVDLQEHVNIDHTNMIPQVNEPTILFVGRDYVLNSASAQMGTLFNFIMNEVHVVDMSHRTEREREEKQNLWDAIVLSKGIVLDQYTVDRVFHLEGNHGFPHVCKLFVIAYQANPATDVEEFFKKPLLFLSNTIRSFLENDYKLSFFKEMILREGRVSHRELETSFKGSSYKVIKSGKDLIGTYLKFEEGVFEFDHPSIYDSVAFNLCKYHPLFVIENCKLSFLSDRLRLEPPHNTVAAPESVNNELIVYVSKPYVKDLAKRFAAEISYGNLRLVLSHQACTDKAFIILMMSEFTLSMTELLKVVDSNSQENFFVLLSSSRSPELLKYLDNNDIRKEFKKALYFIWYGVCKHAASPVLTYLIETNRAYFVNERFGYGKKTPLMIAAETKDSFFVHQILSRKPDINVHDTSGKTALHYLCMHGLVSAVKELIEEGIYINAKDEMGKTALFYACSNGYRSVDLVRLLLNNGAQITGEAVRAACEAGNLEVLVMMFERGVSVNMVLSFNYTPLHVASASGHVEVMKYLIEHGASIDTLDFIGRSPLHKAARKCRECVDVLLKAGADIGHSSTFTPLHEAAQCGCKECTQVLLKAGAEVSMQDEDGITPLHEAARSGSKEIVVMLLKAGADVHVQDKDGNTPLYKAAVAGKDECVEALLEGGADANMQSDSHTPLHAAADSGCTGCIEVLLRHGADVNLQCSTGQTPLHQASKKGCKDCIDILLKGGADVRVQDEHGYTSLHEAAGSGCTGCISILLNYGADVDKQDDYGTTPFLQATERKCTECMYILVTAGADVNIQNKNGVSPLHSASRWGCEECFHLLLRSGSNVNVQSKDGTTPLHFAAAGGNDKYINELLLAGAALNAQCENGYTPLHTAAEWGRQECVDALIKAGAYVEIPSKDGKTPLHTAAELEPKDIMENVDDRDLPYQILYDRAVLKSKGCIDMLLKEGVDVNVTDTVGYTPLHKASEWGCGKCIGLLLKAGADVTVQGKDGYTPLHKAAKCKLGECKECVEMLLKAGSKVNVQNHSGHTPLHKAAGRGFVACVNMLLKAGADVNIRSGNGSTALHRAADSGCVQCIVLLLKAGADVNTQDNDGVSALHSAARSGSEESVEILMKSGSDVNVKSKYDLTPLHEAAAGSCKGCLKLILTAGADVNARSSNDSTSLHIAATWKCKGCINVLLAAGADVNVRSKAGHSPLHNAARIGPKQCHKMVGQMCYRSVDKVSMWESEDSINVLLQEGADVNVKDNNGYTPLHNSAELGCSHCLKLLLAAGSYVNEQTIDGYTALHLASDIGNNECANVPDEVICYTTHHEDAVKLSAESIEVLLKAGADVNLQDVVGASPLHRAAESECSKCVELLVNAGADEHIENIDGETPFS